MNIAYILVIESNNYLKFKNDVKYTWAKFIQISKIIKKLMIIVFTNPNLAFM